MFACQVYECLWDNCDYQFEELQDCLEHCIKDKESQGHVQNHFQSNPDAELHCQWKNCLRNNKKNVQPFPNLARLVRHVRDMHINKGKGRVIPQADRSKYVKFESLAKCEIVFKIKFSRALFKVVVVFVAKNNGNFCCVFVFQKYIFSLCDCLFWLV